MIVAVILLGIIGLGLVILVHELGHFAAARASGVEVEAFSIGWGPKLFSWKRGATEWRISAIPLGGYCRMKGEEAFAAAIQNKTDTIPREPGTFYGAAAWKRILISLAGPLSNVVLAALIFVLVATIGTTTKTYSNRIVLAADFRSSGDSLPEETPAQKAGLKTGDIVLQAGKTPILDYTSLQEAILRSPGAALPLIVQRDGEKIELAVTPFLDKESGAGRIGIYPWVPLVVAGVSPGSPAAIAGIRGGDKVVSIDGQSLGHEMELRARLAPEPQKINLGVERDGAIIDLPVVPNWSNKKPTLGMTFHLDSKVVRSENFGAAIKDGGVKTWTTFIDSVRGIGLLFRGVNVLKAISGPARITYFAGTIAVDSVEENGIGGIVGYFDFLAFLSIALFLMNLLPIPALDGGMIVLFIAELIKRSSLKTRTVYIYQLVGMTLIFGLFALALLSDVLYFSAR